MSSFIELSGEDFLEKNSDSVIYEILSKSYSLKSLTYFSTLFNSLLKL